MDNNIYFGLQNSYSLKLDCIRAYSSTKVEVWRCNRFKEKNECEDYPHSFLKYYKGNLFLSPQQRRACTLERGPS